VQRLLLPPPFVGGWRAGKKYNTKVGKEMDAAREKGGRGRRLGRRRGRRGSLSCCLLPFPPVCVLCCVAAVTSAMLCCLIPADMVMFTNHNQSTIMTPNIAPCTPKSAHPEMHGPTICRLLF